MIPNADVASLSRAEVFVGAKSVSGIRTLVLSRRKMNWKFDFSPETSDIFAAGWIDDGAAMEFVRVLKISRCRCRISLVWWSGLGRFLVTCMESIVA